MVLPSLNEALHRLLHAYQKQLRASIRQHQILLSITQIRVLKGVGRIPDCTAMAIAHRMGQDKSRVTRVLNELAHEGLIERSANPTDRRSQLLEPTQPGMEMLEMISMLEDEAATSLTSQLSNNELETFLRIASIMTKSATNQNLDQQRSEEHE